MRLFYNPYAVSDLYSYFTVPNTSYFCSAGCICFSTIFATF